MDDLNTSLSSKDWLSRKNLTGNFTEIMDVIKSSFKVNPMRRPTQMGIISDLRKNQWVGFPKYYIIKSKVILLQLLEQTFPILSCYQVW